MLLSDPSAHGSLETPIDVQGKATINIEHNFEKLIICFMPCWLQKIMMWFSDKIK